MLFPLLRIFVERANEPARAAIAAGMATDAAIAVCVGVLRLKAWGGNLSLVSPTGARTNVKVSYRPLLYFQGSKGSERRTKLEPSMS